VHDIFELAMTGHFLPRTMRVWRQMKRGDLYAGAFGM
jgi:hypothetical protein